MVTIPGSVTIMLSAEECDCLQKAADIIREFCNEVQSYDSVTTAIYILGPSPDKNSAGILQQLSNYADSFKLAITDCTL